MMDSYFENSFAQFWISDGILFFEYKSHIAIDLRAAQLIVADRIRFQNGVSYPIFCDARGILEMDKPARDFLAQSGSILAKAVGLLVHQQVSSSMSSFYLRVNKPRVPTKSFTDKASVLSFLASYI